MGFKFKGSWARVRVRLDRVQLAAWPPAQEPPDVPYFDVRSDYFVRRQTTKPTYRRVRTYKSDRTGTMLFVQYWRVMPWLARMKITVVPKDRVGLRRPELEAISNAFHVTELRLVEIAFDFAKDSGINGSSVSRCALFGKSRPGVRHEIRRTYGSRKSSKFVRAYRKPGIRAYRVELQLQNSWLRKHDIRHLNDLVRLPMLVVPEHFRFVKINEEALVAHLGHRRLQVSCTLRRVRQADSLHEALSYLREGVGLCNTHRFLRPLKITQALHIAGKNWREEWERDV